MLQWALDLLLDRIYGTVSSQLADMTKAANIHAGDDASDHPCYFLVKLPPELRFRIYEYLILSEHRLIPVPYHSTAKSPQEALSSLTKAAPQVYPIDISILLLNKQIYAEAVDIFYTKNKFTVHYDDFCKCWNGHTISLNGSKIKKFKIQGINFDEEYYPRLWARCHSCETQGFSLVKYLNGLPSLKKVSLAFGDVESFAVCVSAVARKVRKLGKGARLETNEVGRVFVTGTKTSIELRLPALLRVWPPALAKANEAADEYDSDDSQHPLYNFVNRFGTDSHLYLGTHDILNHAIEENSTTEELQPLMTKILSPQGLQVERLDSKELAAFTIALSTCLADVIAEDENVCMLDRRDLVEIPEHEAQVEKNGCSSTLSAPSLRPYSYMTRF